MSAINDGGPAFPHRGLNNDGCTDIIAPGMTLRDWFAGQAMAGLIGGMVQITGRGQDGAALLHPSIMDASYAAADAMLAARNKQEGSK